MNSLAGLILMQSVHADDDATARDLRRTAVQAGATVEQIAYALAIRDEWHHGHVTVLHADLADCMSRHPAGGAR